MKSEQGGTSSCLFIEKNESLIKSWSTWDLARLALGLGFDRGSFSQRTDDENGKK